MNELSTNRRSFIGGMAAGSVAGKVGGLPLDTLDLEEVDTQAFSFSEPPVGLYLNVSGIEGGSASQLHRDEIEALSFSWGMSRESNRGTGRGTSAAQFDPLVVTKGIDKATPQLMEWAATGTQRGEAVLSLTRAIDDRETDVYIVPFH